MAWRLEPRGFKDPALRIISKIGASKCQILRLKCTKFAFRWGSVPNPAIGELYSTPPDPLAEFK